MLHRPSRLGLLSCGLTLALAAQAADPVIDIKPGLWEISVTTNASGEVPDEMLGGVPPAQRAKVKAKILASMQDHDAKTEKHCITAEEIRKGFGDDTTSDCKVSSRTMTGSQLTMVENCPSQNGQTTVKVEMRRLSQEQMSVLATFTMAMGPQTMTIHTNMKGKWIAPACGNADKWSISRH